MEVLKVQAKEFGFVQLENEEPSKSVSVVTALKLFFLSLPPERGEGREKERERNIDVREKP